MKPMEHSRNKRPMDPCQRRRQFGPVQPMQGEDIFEALFTRLLKKVGR
ncbi:hypothetical protein J3454_14225 [Erythrobacter sp. NFXS35]